MMTVSPHVRLLLALVACAAQTLSTKAGSVISTVSTDTLALSFSARGELTAVVDIKGGGRSLLLGSRHTLLGVVLANQTAVTAPSAVSFDQSSGLLRAEFGATPAVYLTMSLQVTAGFITLRIIELDSQPGQVGTAAAVTAQSLPLPLPLPLNCHHCHCNCHPSTAPAKLLPPL